MEEEKLDTFNVPYYIASKEEVQDIVRQEGSFMVERIEALALDVGGRSPEEEDPWTRGKRVAKHVRSFTGSIVQHHLGEEVMDKLYGEKLAELIGEDLSKERSQGISIVTALRKHA